MEISLYGFSSKNRNIISINKGQKENTQKSIKIHEHRNRKLTDNFFFKSKINPIKFGIWIIKIFSDTIFKIFYNTLFILGLFSKATKQEMHFSKIYYFNPLYMNKCCPCIK